MAKEVMEMVATSSSDGCCLMIDGSFERASKVIGRA